jgi:hypothetical protein
MKKNNFKIIGNKSKEVEKDLNNQLEIVRNI